PPGRTAELPAPGSGTGHERHRTAGTRGGGSWACSTQGLRVNAFDHVRDLLVHRHVHASGNLAEFIGHRPEDGRLQLGQLDVTHVAHGARPDLFNQVDLSGVLFDPAAFVRDPQPGELVDRKSTRLNSSHVKISYAVFCLKKKT